MLPATVIVTTVGSRLQPTLVFLHKQLPAWAVGAAFLAGYISAREVTHYKDWMALGEGGLPANVFGWLVNCTYGLFRMRNPRRPRYTPEEKQGGYLSNLPLREGPRPKVAGVIPHRCLDQIPHPEFAIRVEDLFMQLASKHAGKITTRTSQLEKHNPAFFVSHPTARGVSGAVSHEIGHYHLHDHSGHFILHTADAQRVIEHGWGELHPLAGQPTPVVKLPKTYTLLYAPRNDKELAIFQSIIEAAIQYNTAS